MVVVATVKWTKDYTIALLSVFLLLSIYAFFSVLSSIYTLSQIVDRRHTSFIEMKKREQIYQLILLHGAQYFPKKTILGLLQQNFPKECRPNNSLGTVSLDTLTFEFDGEKLKAVTTTPTYGNDPTEW